MWLPDISSSFVLFTRSEGSKHRWRSGWPPATASSWLFILDYLRVCSVYLSLALTESKWRMFFWHLQAGPGTIAEVLIRGLPISWTTSSLEFWDILYYSSKYHYHSLGLLNLSKDIMKLGELVLQFVGHLRVTVSVCYCIMFSFTLPKTVSVNWFFS